MSQKPTPFPGPFILYAALGRARAGQGTCLWRDLRHDLFYLLLSHRKKVPLLTLGDVSGHCLWTVCPKNLGKTSVVVSAGAGRDVSFELALIEHFGCHVFLLDPSPTGIETMSLAKNRHPNLHFMKLALVGKDGPVCLREPGNSLEGSFSSMVGKIKGPEVEGISLPTLLRLQGWAGIDLLKIDIEGAEYDVLDSLLRHKVPVSQICVEYHNQILPGIKAGWTAGSLVRLAWAGWRIIHKSGSNHTLLKDSSSG